MTRSQRLKPIARVARRREELAARTLQDKRRQLVDMEDRYVQLQRYRAEYTQVDPRSGSHSLSASELKNNRRFIEHLESAISCARGQVQQAQQLCEGTQGDWMSARAHSKAIDSVISRHETSEERSREQREQVQTDEHAQRVALRPEEPD